MLGKRLIAGFHHCTNSPCWSKSATPKHILGVSLSQLLRQWRSWRTGSAAYVYDDHDKATSGEHSTYNFRFRLTVGCALRCAVTFAANIGQSIHRGSSARYTRRGADLPTTAENRLASGGNTRSIGPSAHYARAAAAAAAARAPEPAV